LADNTSYTFTVTATNSVGTSSPSASSNSITTPILYPSRKAIFGYGAIPNSPYSVSITNLVTDTGVVGNDVSGVGSIRAYLAAAAYGGDKSIFGYGDNNGGLSMTNLVSNTGVVGNDVTGVGTARRELAAAGYGTDKAIFGYGYITGPTYAATAITNLVSNTGVVATDTSGVGTARTNSAAAGYGTTGQAIFGYGRNNGGSVVSMTNLVSNTGVVSTDTTGVGLTRDSLAAAMYGNDKAIFGYGQDNAYTAVTNLVSNTGVVGNDVTGVGTTRNALAAAQYGTDKAIFGYGKNAGPGYTPVVSITNLVSNTGVVATDTTGVGTARGWLAAATYGP
jgi:hypothetical protein